MPPSATAPPSATTQSPDAAVAWRNRRRSRLKSELQRFKSTRCLGVSRGTREFLTGSVLRTGWAQFLPIAVADPGFLLPIATMAGELIKFPLALGVGSIYKSPRRRRSSARLAGTSLESRGSTACLSIASQTVATLLRSLQKLADCLVP